MVCCWWVKSQPCNQLGSEKIGNTVGLLAAVDIVPYAILLIKEKSGASGLPSFAGFPLSVTGKKLTFFLPPKGSCCHHEGVLGDCMSRGIWYVHHFAQYSCRNPLSLHFALFPVGAHLGKYQGSILLLTVWGQMDLLWLSNSNAISQDKIKSAVFQEVESEGNFKVP